MVFAFITGHMRIPAVTPHGQATTAWLQKHPEYWQGGQQGARAVGALVIEHLGAKEYAMRPEGSYGPTGQLEPEILYATTPELNQLVNRYWQGVNEQPKNVLKPSPLIHFGEGEPLHDRKIPAICLVTGPSYLLAELHSDPVDMPLLKRQVGSFARLLTAYDTLPAAAFGQVVLPSKLRKALTAAKTLRAAEALKRRLA